MKIKVNVGIIGLGKRGFGLLLDVILKMDEIEVVAVCDKFKDRVKLAADAIFENKGNRPIMTDCYEKLLNIDDIDAVIIATGWTTHISIALNAMRAGKYAAFEVGGAYSLEDCWKLVRTYEDTGTPCMMLENCCYGRNELMVLNMVKKGIFGEIIHCSGGYHHDLRREDLLVSDSHHYRLKEYIYRNCESYPTHELGPIAKILEINRGNRMLSLTSTATKSAGLHQYVLDTIGKYDELSKVEFSQGDIVTTVIKCALGQTIVLTLDTTLPRPYYSRAFQVRGVKGMYTEDTDTVYLSEMEKDGIEPCGNGDEFRDKYDHPIWHDYLKGELKGGHDGIDWLIFRAFFESVKNSVNTPIDVYDAASWMSISALSEQSISCGSAPVAIPDFTNGKWLKREAIVRGKFCLEKVYEKDTAII